MRSKIEKKIYAERVAQRLCRTCGDPAIPDLGTCDTCRIKLIWSVNKTMSTANDYQPFSMAKDEFVIWYRTQRDLSEGLCTWCRRSFGKSGMIANHDHVTGAPRALICATCNRAVSVGIERLRKIITALEQWDSLKEPVVAAASTSIADIEKSFPRWARFINTDGASSKKGKLNRDSRINKVIDEIRTRVSDDDMVNLLFNKLREYMENQNGISEHS